MGTSARPSGATGGGTGHGHAVDPQADGIHLQAALDAMIDPFILMAAVRDDTGALVDLRYTAANEAALRYNHLTREQLIGARLLDLFPGQLEHGPLRQYFDTIETGVPTILDDYTYAHEILGEERFYDIRATKAGDGLALTWRDVTDRHAAVEQLSESERLYRLLADYSSDAIAVSDDARTFAWVSDTATSVLGYPPEELVGLALADFVHPDDRPGLARDIQESHATGTVARVRNRWRLPDGSYCWIESAGRPAPDPLGGHPDRRVVAMHRVDEQVRTEEELRQHQHLYELVTTQSSDVSVLVDDDFVIQFVSPSVHDLVGWRPEELVGRRGPELIHPDDVVGLREEIARADAEGRGSRYRYRWLTADGDYRWVEGHGRKIDEPGGLRGRVVHLRNIDAQVEAEESRTSSEHLLQAVVDNSIDAILLTSSTAKIIWASPAAETALNWPADDLVGHAGLEFLHPDDAPSIRDGIAESNRTMSPLRLQLRWRRPDGDYTWCEASGRPFVDESTGDLRRIVALRPIDEQMRAQRELAEAQHLYRLVAEHSTDVVIVLAEDSRATWVSPSVEATLGWRPDEIVGHSRHDFVHPDDLRAIDQAMAGTGVGGDRGSIRQRYRMRTKGGDYRWFEGTRQLVHDDLLHQTVAVIRLRDINDQVTAESARAEAEATYRMLAENASDVVWQVDQEGRLLWVSPSVKAILGWPAADLVGTPSAALVVPEDRERFAAAVDRVRDGQPMAGEFRLSRNGGGMRWMEVSLRAARAEDAAARIGTLRDIDDVIQARRQMDFALQHDQATGLPVRRAMMDRIARVQRTLGPHRRMSVLTVGVDHLKEVNDAFGHGVGDAVITTLAGRIAQALDDPQSLGRGSGDEFIVLVADFLDAGAVAQLAERIRKRAHGTVEILGHRVDPTVSIGIAQGDSTTDVEGLLRESTLAMHHAKAQGRDRWLFADPDLAHQAAQRMAVEADIRIGLDTGEFVAWFQPIVSLRDGHTAGYEALVRWPHEGQILLPDDFLPVAEQSGLITSIDLLMAEHVVRQLATIPTERFISLNVTGATLASAPYADHIEDLLARHHVAPSRLHLEITETRLFRVEPAIVEPMRRLADVGTQWYVDDFGTGYSSISHVRDLPVAGLKLDKSFTEGIREGEEKSRNLADALLGLANGLGLDTVAEGIETPAEAAYLRTLGWRHGQGWLYGKAEPLG